MVTNFSKNYIPDSYLEKLLAICSQYDVAAIRYMRNNPFTHKKAFVLFAGVRSEIIGNERNWEEIDGFLADKYAQGWLNYDLKNHFEKLSSRYQDVFQFPLFYFFEPQVILVADTNGIHAIQGEVKKETDIQSANNVYKLQSSVLDLEKYKEGFDEIKKSIARGDIYETNYCNQLEIKGDCNPYRLFYLLNEETKAPHNSFFKWNSKYILCASPERFIKKQGGKLSTEPIKGTAKRGLNKLEDDKLRESLNESLKDFTENVMIVDLVRNDLSKIATKGSVQVTELAKVYTFPTVHQRISKISCNLKQNSFQKIIEATFPMGSMTGAPKVSAMKISDRVENFNRGVYSGSLVIHFPNGDFDTNVVIRTIIYDKKIKFGNIGIGGAITDLSSLQDEYEECEVKSKAILKSLEKMNLN